MSPEPSLVFATGFPILGVLVLFPLIWCCVMGLLRSGEDLRRLAIVGASVELLLSIWAMASVQPGVADLQLVERYPWIPTLGAELFFGVDGISAPFLPLTACVVLLVLVGSWNSVVSLHHSYALAVFALEAALMGVYVSLDLVMFFLFWEATLLPLFFLISLWGIGPQRGFAANKMVLTMMVAGAPLLLGILVLGWNHASWSEAQGLGFHWSFAYPDLLNTPMHPDVQVLVFALMLVGFGVKTPMFPLHSWMSSALMEGPRGVGVVIVGFKLGLYGLLRFGVTLVPVGAVALAPLLAGLGIFGALYGALVSLRQSNLRRMMAFAGLSHAGLALVGIASLNAQGLHGAQVQVLNMALLSSGLFFVASFIHRRTGSGDLDTLGGLANTAPRLAGFFVLLSVAGIGLPGTSGFVAEHLLFVGIWQAKPLWALLLLPVGVLGAAASFRCIQEALLGPVSPACTGSPDLRPRELVVVGVLGGLSLLGGLVPGPGLDFASGSISAIVQRADTARASLEVSHGSMVEHAGALVGDAAQRLAQLGEGAVRGGSDELRLDGGAAAEVPE